MGETGGKSKNSSLMEKIIKFDRHARRRMKWRKISEEEVLLTLEDPDRIEESIKGRLNAYKKIGQRLIKITYKEIPGEIVIISAVQKEWGERNENRV